MTKMYRLEVLRCGAHPDFWAVCLSDDDGGTRLTGSKCCGRWDGVSRKTGKTTTKGPYLDFHLTAAQLREAADVFTHAAELAQQAEDAYDHAADESDARIPES